MLVLVTAVVLALALAAPAGAKPTPSGIVTQSWSGCDMTVTYTWSDFTGRVTAGAEYIKSPNSAGAVNFQGLQGHGGTLSYTFNFTSTTQSNDFTAEGFLVDHKGTIIPASLVQSSSESHPCS